MKTNEPIKKDVERKYTLTIEEIEGERQTTVDNEGFSISEIVFVLDSEKFCLLQRVSNNRKIEIIKNTKDKK